MRKLAVGFLGILAACSPSASSAKPVAQPLRSDAPKLVIAISVDQFSADLWDEYRPRFRGGLARIAGGTVFRNGYHSHAATETCPGHSTLLTGKRPGSNGIVANLWVDNKAPRPDKAIYCAEDESVPGSTSTSYTVSPKHLNARTLGDLLKASSPASRNVAVAGKDRAAVMMGGRNVDQRWYWDGKTFSTDLAGVTPPRSIGAFRAALANAIGTARPALDPPALCTAKSRAYQLTPALKVGDNRCQRAAGDARQFRISPEFDGVTLALAAALIQEMRLGRGPATDLLSIGLSATDYVGHAYGTDGMEMCLQLLALDRELGDFLAMLDKNRIDYAVMLTADHGGMDIPERLREKGVAGAARAEPGLAAAEVGKLLAPRFGRTESVLKGLGIGGDVWVDAGVPEAQKAAVYRAAKLAYMARPQVYAAFTRDEVMAVPMPSGAPDRWSIIQRVRASFEPTRSGDLVVVLKEHISPIPVPSFGYSATHGSPWDYDRRVPIAFWRKGVAGTASDQAVETVDIMPTLAAMIGVPLQPGSVEGRCLAAAGVHCSR
jgi:predicted AlkP superfamily pyrophosphatase or phosphodiesterase